MAAILQFFNFLIRHERFLVIYKQTAELNAGYVQSRQNFFKIAKFLKLIAKKNVVGDNSVEQFAVDTLFGVPNLAGKLSQLLLVMHWFGAFFVKVIGVEVANVVKKFTEAQFCNF